MSRTNPTIGQLLQAVIDSRLLDVHTALPAKITYYDSTTQTVDVQPLIKQTVQKADETLVHSSLPVIPAIPLAIPRWGSWFISAPVAAGDFVYIIFSEQSIRLWRELGTDTESGDLRRHPLDGAVAMPVNLYPKAQPLASVHATNMVVGNDTGAQIHIKPTGEIDLYEENAAEFVALATKVLTELTSIQSQVNTLITTFNANVAIFAAHTHGGVTVGAGVTGVAIGAMAAGTPLTAPNAVNSLHVKAT